MPRRTQAFVRATDPIGIDDRAGSIGADLEQKAGAVIVQPAANIEIRRLARRLQLRNELIAADDRARDQMRKERKIERVIERSRRLVFGCANVDRITDHVKHIERKRDRPPQRVPRQSVDDRHERQAEDLRPDEIGVFEQSERAEVERNGKAQQRPLCRV